MANTTLNNHLTLSLLPEHVAMLQASAIAPEIANARGYRSIGTADARDLGFTGSQARHGLLIPRWSLWGQDGYQLRLTEQRVVDGKPRRYETPPGQPNRLDVHPSMVERVRSPKEAVFITEGCKKADCLTSLGIPTIALAGVWAWRGTNEFGGKTALADWQDINVKGSVFVLAFDRDIYEKPAVYMALRMLAAYLMAKGALLVRFLVPPEPFKGIDDWVAARLGEAA